VKNEMTDNNELKGLRGWLIVVGLGVVINPVQFLAAVAPVVKPIFEKRAWEALTTVESESYIPYLGTFLIGEISFYSIMFIASLCLVYFFFTRHYLFPRVYVCVVAAWLMFIPLEAWVSAKILPGASTSALEATGDFIATFMLAAIWIPYMLLSVRVKATFVEGRPDKHMQPSAESAG
jgi:hypothetical protein